MKLHRRERWLGAVMAGAGLSLTLVCLPSAGASMGAVTTSTAKAITAGGTFYAAQAWGTLPDNFNPYAPSGANAPGTKSCLYQSLYYFNAATGAETPLLGTNYTWTDNNLRLTVTTRNGVKWSDGTPFTAADVAFTFNYLKANPSIDVNGIWTSPLKSVVATGANTVVFTFSKPDTPEARCHLVRHGRKPDGHPAPAHLGDHQEPCEIHEHQPGRHGPVHAQVLLDDFGRLRQEPELLGGWASVHRLGGIQLGQFGHDS